MEKNKDKRLETITYEELVDMRLEGLSFDRITEKINEKNGWNLTKMQVYKYYTYIIENGLSNNYEPFPLKEITKKLEKNWTIEEISEYYNVEEKGLRNYLKDMNILKFNATKIKKMYQNGKSINQIALYFGSNYHTMRKWMIENTKIKPIPNNTRSKQINLKKEKEKNKI